MLDVLLLVLQIVTLVLLFLFIWWVVRSARRDLAHGVDGAQTTPPPAASWEAASWVPPPQGAPPPTGHAPGSPAGSPVGYEPDADWYRQGAAPVAARAVAGLQVADPAAHPRLIVEASPVLVVGSEIVLTGRLGIGRSPNSDVTLNEPFVSSAHAGVSHRGGRFFVTDLGSTNGTYVNGSRVAEAELQSGARLRIGETTFRFED